MRTVIIGNRKIARYLLKHLFESHLNVVGAVAADGNLAVKQANFTPFDELVTSTEAELIKTSDINSEETKTSLRSLDPDVCFCPAWSQIIEKEVLEIPTHGFIGIHSSRLPKGRGGAPVNWSMIYGENKIWVSIFEYTPQVDAGKVYEQRAVSVEDRDDVKTMFEKIASVSCEMVDTVAQSLYDGTLSGTPQSLATATYRPRRQPQDGYIRWSKDPIEQRDWIRALTQPYPGAFTFYAGEKLVIWNAEQTNCSLNGTEQGEVLNMVNGQGIDVRTGDGAIRLQWVQYAGRPATWADTLAEQLGIASGDFFGREHAPTEWVYTGIRDGDGRTDFDTNLSESDSGEIRCIVDTPNCDRSVEVTISMNRQCIHRAILNGRGRLATTASYSMTESGTATLKITFDEGDDRLDTRYLKVFCDS